MNEKTLVLVKPDAVKDNNIGRILAVYEKNDLKIIAVKMLRMTEALASKHYQEHIGKPFYQKLVAFMTSGPLVAAVLQGEDAVKRVRSIHGATDPEQAEKGTVRSLFAADKTRNAVHASDSAESAVREIHVFFSEAEIFDIG